MDPDELAFAGAARQAELVRTGAVSARDVVAACLARIERLDGELRAFREVFADEALAAAEDPPAGPLRGVPVALKAEVDEGQEFERRVRAAGAIVVGTTNLPELAAWPFTETERWGISRNPWDTERTPGGSSGGSAAAVAAGMCGAALGSDGGGSIRIPAAACGIFGLKPSRGRFPHGESWGGLTALGPLARRVADAALLYDAAAGTELALAACRAPARLRIAWSLAGAYPARVRADAVRGAVLGTVDLLQALGHTVERRDPRYGPLAAAYVPRYLTSLREEAAGHDELEPRSRALARLGALHRPLLPIARVAGRAVERRLATLFEDFDVLLLPVTPAAPPAAGRWAGRGALRTMAGVARAWAPFTLPWNLTGQPAASVPAGFDDDGLPLAVQLVARHGAEETLVALAAQLEAERGWQTVRPDCILPTHA